MAREERLRSNPSLPAGPLGMKNYEKGETYEDAEKFEAVHRCRAIIARLPLEKAKYVALGTGGDLSGSSVIN